MSVLIDPTHISQKNLFLKLDEARMIMASISPAEEKHRVLLLLVFCGLRPCEAVQLHLSSFATQDYCQLYAPVEKRRANVPRHKRLLVVPAWIGQRIRRYVEAGLAYGQFKGGYLFPGTVPGKRPHMSSDSLTAWFYDKRKKLGLDLDVVDTWQAPHQLAKKGVKMVKQHRVQLYSFRRLLATMGGLSGIPQKYLSELMGHSDQRIVNDYQQLDLWLKRAPIMVERLPRISTGGQTMLSSFTA